LGIELFSTYLDRSGVGGHSDFNIYCDISGIAGHGGTLAFNTYLERSGSLQGAQGGQTGRVGPLGPAQPEQGQLLPQRLHLGPGIPSPNWNPINPSDLGAGVEPLPTRYPTTMAATTRTTI